MNSTTSSKCEEICVKIDQMISSTVNTLKERHNKGATELNRIFPQQTNVVKKTRKDRRLQQIKVFKNDTKTAFDSTINQIIELMKNDMFNAFNDVLKKLDDEEQTLLQNLKGGKRTPKRKTKRKPTRRRSSKK